LPVDLVEQPSGAAGLAQVVDEVQHGVDTLDVKQ